LEILKLIVPINGEKNMKKIDRNNKIFESEAYKRDRNQFHIIELNLAFQSPLLYSDEDNYVICCGQKGKPIWIWTVDKIERNVMKEVAEVLEEQFLNDTTICKFTAKRDFYSFLKETGYPYLNDEDYFEMGSLECCKVKQPRICDGYSEKAVAEDIDTLAKYWYEDNKEMNPALPITLQQAYEEIKSMIASDHLWIWRNSSEKVVSMVHYGIAGNQVKLSHVYTPEEERRKGYAANLIHDVTKLLLESHLNPLLYTDYHYIASNKAYKNAGYVETGVLINFSCSKKK